MAPRTPGFRLETFFGFRAPLLPHAEWRNWSAGLGAVGHLDDPAGFAQAYAEDLRLLRERLRGLVARPEILESLQVASPDLVDSIPRWVTEPDSEKGQRSECALVRYFARMCHRPTPFGLFASHAMGRAGEATRLEVVGQDACQRRSRLDMGYLCNLVAAFQKDPGLRETLVLRPNTSLYRIGDRLRYAQARFVNGERALELVAVQTDEVMDRVLALAKEGCALLVLAEALLAEDLSRDEASAYIHDLMDHQILVPDLEPPTTGPEPLPELIGILQGAASSRPMAQILAEAAAGLASLDANGLGNAPDAYEKLVQTLEALPIKVDRARLWQVDLFRPAPAVTLGPAFREDMVRAMELLIRLTPKEVQDPFQAFKEAFRKRYEERWVPLAEALDPECGVGFFGTSGQAVIAAPLLDGFVLGAQRDAGQGEAPGLKPYEVHLLKRILELREKGGRILELTEADIEAMADDRPGMPIPSSFSCVVELAGASPEALAAGEYRAFISGAAGPTAARMLGRFCHGDASLHAEVERHLRLEEGLRPHALFAEIAHLSHGRMGNVLARPVLRAFEIPYLGRSGAQPEQWLELEDLHVGIVEDRVVLWSRRLNREVIPRLSSAANYHHRVTDVFRFLASLQDQGVQGTLGFTWGNLASEATLPRVVFGAWVLARAHWGMGQEELMGLQQAKDAKERFLAMQRLRQKRHMPQHVLLADGDNELPVDLDNALCIEAFWGAAKNRESALLIEDYPGGKHLVASGPEGAFTHQLVLAFLAEPGAPGVPTPSPNLSEPMVRHAPGSEWLYAKLYTGQHSMEKLLAGPLNILTQEVMEAGDADRWFFIRYADPEPHLRLRFHGDPTRLWAMVLPRLQSALDPLLRNGWLWRFQLDTYEPELFRYGGANNQERAEQIFMADSEAAMKILAHHPGDEGIRGRWPLALASMDEYLASAGLSLGARLTMAQARLSGFSREFGLQGNPTSHQLGVRFRQERRLLETLFCPGQPPEGHLALGLAALAERSRRISPWLRSMGALEESGKLTTTLEDLLGSMIHMSVNRLLMSSQRAQEMILYDFLVRIYASRLAREGQTAGAQASTPAL